MELGQGDDAARLPEGEAGGIRLALNRRVCATVVSVS
jgi:hypothetical protein